MAHLIRGELVYNDGMPVAEAQKRPGVVVVDMGAKDCATPVSYTNPHYETTGIRRSDYGDSVDSTGVFSVREASMQTGLATLVAAESIQLRANAAGLSHF